MGVNATAMPVVSVVAHRLSFIHLIGEEIRSKPFVFVVVYLLIL